MRKITGILALMVIMVMVTGCATSAGISAWKANAGGHARVHCWEEPHFTADLESNPVQSELGTGFVTVGSHAGWSDSEGKWVTFGLDVGPDKAPPPDDIGDTDGTE